MTQEHHNSKNAPASALSPGSGAPATLEPPFTPALVEELLRHVDKTARAHQLYPSHNPIYRKMLDASRAAFAAVWAQAPSITLQVTDTEFTWWNVNVLSEPEKVSDSLPWTLYKDGVREITLSAGFEGDELERLLDIIPRVRRKQDHEDDIVALLWEGEFLYLNYRFIDTLTAEGAPLDPSATPGRWPASAAVARIDPRLAVTEAKKRLHIGAGGEGTASGTAGAASPKSHIERVVSETNLARLEALPPALPPSGAQMGYLAREIEREYSADLRRSVLDILMDMFETQPDRAVREEVAQNIDAMSLHLLTSQDVSNVTHLLRESTVALDRLTDLPPELRLRFEKIVGRVSDPAMLGPLFEALDASENPPPTGELSALFARLGPRALGTLLIWSKESKHPSIRSMLAVAADRLSLAGTDELVKLINSGDPRQALEAMRRAGEMRLEDAVLALVRELGDENSELRAAAAAALVDIDTPRAMSGLERSLDDATRETRMLAMRTLTSRKHKPALRRATELLGALSERDVDPTERLALFELYGVLCGDEGIPLLDKMLNGSKGFFKRREDPELRAGAAAGLGFIGTPAAHVCLRKALNEKDPLIRRAVARALASKPQ